jgi:8-oxo-dGTP pyrophosphatase MutT (NUDIX family)
LSDGKWSLPGGGLYRSETAPEGVVRELYEETGLKLTAMEIAYKETRTFSQHGLRCEYSMFIAHATSLYPLKREHFEIVEATWVKIRELSSANAAPDVLHAIQTWLL